MSHRRPRPGGLRRLRATALLALLAAGLALADAAALRAQIPGIRGYALNVGGYAAETAVSPDGFFDLQRVRLMARPALGPLAFDLAYEHTLDIRSGAGGGLVEGVGGVVAARGWLALDGAIRETDRFRWRHRADRLNVAVPLPGGVHVRVGRQTISWATTLILTPADPFAPFDPADPFREFRAGVDAIRVRYFPGPFSEIEAVVRPLELGDSTVMTALGRWQGLVGGWEVAGWGGVLHDRFGAGSGAAGSVGPVAVRAEASIRDAGEDGRVLRAAAGADGRRVAAGRDLFLAVELRYDGFGAADGGELIRVAASRVFRLGELQLLGRWAAAGSAALQLHPLASAELLALVNLGDPSALLAPGFTISMSDEVSLRLGGFVGIGSGAERLPEGGARPTSEFGMAPSVLYGAVSVFF